MGYELRALRLTVLLFVVHAYHIHISIISPIIEMMHLLASPPTFDS